MDKSIYQFILRYSMTDQVVLLLVTLCSFPFLYYSLDLPKIIINSAISAFDPQTRFLGLEVDQISYLLILSSLFLSMVVINGVFKYYINTFKGRIGERMLRRLRYQLYARMLRFPLPHFKKISAGEIIPMITIEVEPLGGFIGEAIAQPAFQGGTLFVYIMFIFIQDPFLGLAAIALYPVQGFLIPHLQKKVNALGKRRVRTMRQISDKIGETVAGAQAIHNHDMSAYHRADLTYRLGDIYDIRYEIFRRKYMIKFINNFINQLTPFFFYSIGGYLVIVGEISFGSLIAVLAAYKDMAGPWRELLIYYQLKEDARIKYDQVIEQFQPANLMSSEMQETEPPKEEITFQGTLQLNNVTLEEESGSKSLDALSGAIKLDQITAIVSDNNEDLAPILARLIIPTSGTIFINHHDFTQLSQTVTGRRISYVGPLPYLFSGTVWDNLLYGLRHRPLEENDIDSDKSSYRDHRLKESLASGNSTYDIRHEWTDYRAAGCASMAELECLVLDVIERLDLTREIYELGLSGRIDIAKQADVPEQILRARQAIQEIVTKSDLSKLIEHFDPDRFNTNATVGENILFGHPLDATFAPDSLSGHPYFRSVLDRVGLTDRFIKGGLKVAELMLEIFTDLPPGHELFERFSFITSDDLPMFDALRHRITKEGFESLTESDQACLIALVLKLIPAQHRIGVVTPEMKEDVIRARVLFAQDLPESLRSAVDFFDVGRYNVNATIQDNILFGRLVKTQMHSAQRSLRDIITEVVERLGLHQTILQIGLQTQVGIAGSWLSSTQRQKIVLAQALIKNPDLLIIDRATASFDGVTQIRLHETLIEFSRAHSVVWFVHRPSLSRLAQHVLVLMNGQIVEEGIPETLMSQSDSILHRLIAQEA